MSERKLSIDRLSERIINEIKELERKRNTLVASLRETRIHMGDENQSGTENECILTISIELKRISSRLEKLYQAQNRIFKGIFGICENCEEGISIERMEARPESSLCIKCKEGVERLTRLK